MKTMVRSLLVLVLAIVVAAPVYSAAATQSAAQSNPSAAAGSAAAEPYGAMEILHIFACEMEDGVTEEQVDQIAQQKLKALQKLPGAEKARVHVLWPAVVSNTGETDFQIVWILPSFTDWGKLWDAYDDASELARGDDATEGKVVCPDSMLWEAHEIVLPK